jgi:hypothetical protein
MGGEIKSPPVSGPYFFRIHGQIYHLVSQPYSNEANKPGYVQLYIFDSAEPTIKRLENPSNQDSTAEITQRFDEML